MKQRESTEKQGKSLMKNTKCEETFSKFRPQSKSELLLSPVCDTGIQKLKTGHENINIML